MSKVKLKLKEEYLERQKLIEELALLSAIKRRSSPEFKEFKKKLLNEQKNICFGSLCNGKIHTIDLFAKNRHECKECYSQRICNSYRRNNGASRQRTIYLLKAGKSCEQCDCSDPLMLEFDHLDPNNKIDSIARLNSSKKILEEVGKTKILCVWHHRLRTKIQIGSVMTTTNKDFIDNTKLSIGQCQICEKNVTPETTCCFDFDHINPSEKVMNVSRAASTNTNIDIIIDEISKCQLLCCYCHRRKTAEQFNYPQHHKIKIKLKKDKYINQCADCNTEIDKDATRCGPCHYKTTRKVKDRPSLAQIYKDLNELGSYVQVGKKYGVSDNAIRKWIKKSPKFKIKLKQDVLSVDSEQIIKPKLHLKLKQNKTQSSQTKICIDCAGQIYKTSNRCLNCQAYKRRVVNDRPSLEQILNDYKELGTYKKVGEKYGVARKSISNWIKTYQKSQQIITTK